MVNMTTVIKIMCIPSGTPHSFLHNIHVSFWSSIITLEVAADFSTSKIVSRVRLFFCYQMSKSSYVLTKEYAGL